MLVEGRRPLAPIARLSALVLLGLLGCAPQPGATADMVVATPLEDAAALPRQIGELELLGAYELRAGDRDFGGISAARRREGRLLLLSDRSVLYDLDWPSAGLSGTRGELAVRDKRPLTNARGTPIDSEALVVLADGSIRVGNEGTGRVLTFPAGQSRANRDPLRLSPAFSDAGRENRGLETLTLLPERGLLALLEGDDGHGVHAGVIVGEEGPEPVAYRSADGFQVTDADVAGDWLLVLERRLSLLGGWQTRVVAVPLAAVPPAPGTTITGRELARIAGGVLSENYEGLAAWSGPDGAIAVTLVSDDNFNPLQSTQLLDLRWRP